MFTPRQNKVGNYQSWIKLYSLGKSDPRWPQPASLEVGLGFPVRDRIWITPWKHQILATRPVVSDKTMALQFCRKGFPQRWEVVIQLKCLLEEKGSLWIDTWVGSERESHLHGSLNHLYEAFIPGCLSPAILLCLVLSPYLAYLRIPTCVRAHPSQDGLQAKGLG